jgi:hypothetical protein
MPFLIVQHLFDAYLRGNIAVVVAANATFQDLERQTAAELQRQQQEIMFKEFFKWGVSFMWKTDEIYVMGVTSQRCKLLRIA